LNPSQSLRDLRETDADCNHATARTLGFAAGTLVWDEIIVVAGVGR
jgi:hypothetical protein